MWFVITTEAVREIKRLPTDRDFVVKKRGVFKIKMVFHGEKSFWEDYGLSISIGAVILFVIIIVILFRHKKTRIGIV